MSKILILANHYNTLRIFRRELIIRLAQDGHEVLIAIPECEPEYKKVLEDYGTTVQFIEMERRGMNPLKDIKLIETYKKLIAQFQPDKVIAYTIKCNIYGAYACKKKNLPFYANITGLGSTFQGQGKTRKLVSAMYKHSLDKAKKIFFENVGNRDTLVEDGIIRKEQTVVMPGAGVNLEEFHYYPYPDDKDGVTFLFVGRIMQEKGVDELFEAIEYICQKYPKTVFDFIGWYEDDYKERFEALQNKGYTRFDGWQADVRPFYEKCHCIIHPSWHEGMSNTLLEGAACGRPLITNKIHGCMEAVDEGVNGFLCEKKSAESIKENLERFLQLSNEQRRKMGVAGREKMQREFDKFDVVEKTIGHIFED